MAIALGVDSGQINATVLCCGNARDVRTWAKPACTIAQAKMITSSSDGLDRGRRGMCQCVVGQQQVDAGSTIDDWRYCH